MFGVKNALAGNNKQKKQKYVWATIYKASFMAASLTRVPWVLQC